MIPPVATYRIQLRNGVTFEDVARDLPRLAGLGISHVYLSPILQARQGSTHGYDVIDPTCIDDTLGGAGGFARLAAAVRAQGMAILLDIVPNHTAFDPANPWLADVLRHGRGSRFARHFDIDWDSGPLILPFLPEPFEALARRGSLRVETGANPWLVWEGLRLPLAPRSADGPVETAEDLLHLHEAQAWRLADRSLERDGITHRRFFNITDLIGMRIEDPQVFEDMHRTVLDLVRSGQVQALRIDHIDGLARPGEYLDRLRAAVGEAPIWVEKILTGAEDLPVWPVQGTTGYEAAVAISGLLTDPDGLAAIDADWRAVTGAGGSYPEVLAAAKAEILDFELAAEVRKLMDLAEAALAGAPEAEFGRESLREAVRGLLTAFPRYRTYLGDGEAAGDRALIAGVADQAAAPLRDPRAVQALARLLLDPANEAAHRFRTRFQQTTGAVMAKSHEDTGLFRHVRYLAANEVGSEPDRPCWSVADFVAWANRRAEAWPQAMVLTSSHDTKRSEDARMRIAAISHLPEEFGALYRLAAELAPGVAPAHLWYLVQSWLAIHDAGRADLADRLAAHMQKALREAKQGTTPTHPVPEHEAPVEAAARRLVAAWGANPPGPARRLIALGEDLSLAQAAVKLLLPGVPDIYQGSETGTLHLTDPDNRLPVEALRENRGGGQGWRRQKHDLIATLLALHRPGSGFARRRLAEDGPGPGLRLRVEAEGFRVHLRFAPGRRASEPPGRRLWPAQGESPLILGCDG